MPSSLNDYTEKTVRQLAAELKALQLGLTPPKIQLFAEQFAQMGQVALDALVNAKLPELNFMDNRIGSILLKTQVPGWYMPYKQLQQLNSAHNGPYRIRERYYNNGNLLRVHDLRISTGIPWPKYNTLLGKILRNNPAGGRLVTLLKNGVSQEKLTEVLTDPSTRGIPDEFLNFHPPTGDELDRLLKQARKLNTYISRFGG